MRNGCMLCVVLVCASPAVRAAEVQVNVRTSGSQANPAVALEAAGGSIVVWSSRFGTAGRSNDILARRLDPLGAFAGNDHRTPTHCFRYSANLSYRPVSKNNPIRSGKFKLHHFPLKEKSLSHPPVDGLSHRNEFLIFLFLWDFISVG